MKSTNMAALLYTSQRCAPRICDLPRFLSSQMKICYTVLTAELVARGAHGHAATSYIEARKTSVDPRPPGCDQLSRAPHQAGIGVGSVSPA